MLAMRMQRTGRSGHAQFRVVVQDSRFSPKSGRVVAYLGNYDPHTKAAKLDGEKVSKYLGNGAQPSGRVIQLLQKEGINLPSWVTPATSKKRAVRKPEKRRSTRPKDTVPATKSEKQAQDGKPDAKVEASEPQTPEDIIEEVTETEAETEAEKPTTEETQPSAEDSK